MFSHMAQVVEEDMILLDQVVHWIMFLDRDWGMNITLRQGLLITLWRRGHGHENFGMQLFKIATVVFGHMAYIGLG